MGNEQTTKNNFQSDMYLPEQNLNELFVDVQMGNVFTDSKTFVDCIPRQHPATIVAAYKEQKRAAGFSLKEFVHQHFTIPAPIDSVIIFPEADMITHLRKHWPKLVRESTATEKYTSLISLPHPYIVPGGRFREMFYWDSYFTIIGLLESNEDALALGMIRNFEHLVNTFGYIPNGNRTYFLSRSQPPFFAEILKAYTVKNGIETIISFLPALEKEYNYWTAGNKWVNTENRVSGKAVWINEYVLNRYTGTIATPRPEAYNKEYKWAQNLPEEQRPAFYLHLRAACESGWDFSSRWFADGKNKITIKCESMIPVCLNSLLYNCEMQLSIMHEYSSNKQDAAKYRSLATHRKEGIIKFCWSEKEHVFTDYQFINQTQNPIISLATVYPLFFGVATQPQANKIAQIIKEKFLHAGGVVTTLNTSGEQWDSPNGWAPLQWLAVIGLHRYGHTDLAKIIVTRWLSINEKIYLNEHKMMEKYNVVNPGLPGGGGNYENQDGFGWTNGVALALNSWLKSVN